MPKVTGKVHLWKVDLAGTELSTFGTIQLISWLTDAKTAQPAAPPEAFLPMLPERSGLI